MEKNKLKTKPIVVSGLKPSGKLHIGNYLGMLKNAVALQDSGKYRTFYFIADYHSLTQKFDVREKTAEIFEMAVDALATGLDPKKSVIFLQSHVTEHANLSWILSNLTSMGNLERMVEYKEKLEQGQVPNAGLFTYPILMAADILLYKSSLVPVGEDQRQHLELAREIARTFNSRFGKTLPEPKALHTESPRIMSLSNPAKKMSKSLPQGCLYLTDSPDKIRTKVKTAVTDSYKEIAYDQENRPAVANLIRIYSDFSNKNPEEVAAEFKGRGYAEFKESLASLIIKSLRPFQEKRVKLLKNRKAVVKILDDGARVAHAIAEKNLAEIKKKVGLI